MKWGVLIFMLSSSLAYAEGITSSVNPRVLLRTTNTWTAQQNFQSIDVSSAVFGATITAHTGRFQEIFTSTVVGGSPLTVNGIKALNFGDGSQQFTAAVTANFSSVTIGELYISTSMTMQNNKLFYDSDKNSYTFYDAALNSVRHFLDGLEMFRLKP